MAVAIIEVRNLSFTYPALTPGQGDVRALEHVSLQVEEGAFCVLSGPTGCGKSTLLRLMKPEIAPRGTVVGSLSVDGMELAGDDMRAPLTPAASARLVGFVAQDPEAQVTCDTVRAELAFGLENLGVAPAVMRRRIAEVTCFLGMDSWMDRATAALSGGQKQLLNVAAVLALRPRVLLLDEPAAQLDPYARRRFLDALAAVNRELGCTVLMTTHAPELAAPYATQHVELGPLPHVARYDDALRLAPAAGGHAETPSPRRPENGKDSLSSLQEQGVPFAAHAAPRMASREGAPPVAVRLREVDFRYARREPWVLRDASALLERGRVHAFLGGNGCGKTTLLKLFAGLLKPQRGKVEAEAGLRRAYLPQDPKAVFSCDSTGEELHEWHARFGYGEADEETATQRFGLDGLLERHPYDLSGGQQQQLALAKLMLTRPQLLLLDEPTKGLDARAAAQLARLVRQVADEGCAVALATHDTAFVRMLADTVSLVFDAAPVCTLMAAEYFADTLVRGPHDESRLFGARAESIAANSRLAWAHPRQAPGASGEHAPQAQAYLAGESAAVASASPVSVASGAAASARTAPEGMRSAGEAS